MKSPRILVYGYGNPGRQDDGLGVMLAEQLEEWVLEEGVPFVETDQNYQLNIEDAERISSFDYVIFADASLENIDACFLERLKPDLRTDFSMHSVVPSFVLGLCEQIFHKQPECYQLHIKAYDFEFMQAPGSVALNNLSIALSEVQSFIVKRVGAALHTV